jgi:hypothetical protein
VAERSSLEKFLFAPTNSHAKESLINNKLLFDLKLAAAENGYFLNAYLPEVDQDGFDVIFDDHDLVLKTQLKTVMKGAKTSSWQIHKRLLRPELNYIEKLGFEFSPFGEGVGGGIILMEIDASENLKIRYLYTDIIIQCGFRDGLLDTKYPPRDETVNNFFNAIYDGPGSDRVAVPKGMFLEARSPTALLGLMGLQNIDSTTSWRSHLMNLANPTLPENELPSPFGTLRGFVNEELVKLSPRIKLRK